MNFSPQRNAEARRGKKIKEKEIQKGFLPLRSSANLCGESSLWAAGKARVVIVSTVALLCGPLLSFARAEAGAAEELREGVEFNGVSSFAVVREGNAFDFDAFTVSL